MFRKLVPAALLAATLGATGCYGSGTVAYSAEGSYATPDLVPVGDGVQVIANYDEPIFYANGAYWYQAEGGWYRSSVYTGGWAYEARPPVVIARIGSPTQYRHYRPANYVVRRRPVPVQRIERPRVTHRDHRR